MNQDGALMLPLPGERAGVRESVWTNKKAMKSVDWFALTSVLSPRRGR